MESPCYDRKLSQGCPDRRGGCSVTCERWAMYLKIRELEYKQRRKQADAEANQFEYSQARNKRLRVDRRKQR